MPRMGGIPRICKIVFCAVFPSRARLRVRTKSPRLALHVEPKKLRNIYMHGVGSRAKTHTHATYLPQPTIHGNHTSSLPGFLEHQVSSEGRAFAQATPIGPTTSPPHAAIQAALYQGQDNIKFMFLATSPTFQNG